MRITMTGATGFLGRNLVQMLSADGHSICLLTRKPVTGLPGNVEIFLWDPPRVDPPAESLRDSDAVIHLAGKPIAQRWTPATKKELVSSRLDSTRVLVQALSTLTRRPPLLLSASAIGFYGERGDELLDETSAVGDGFLAKLSEDWEKQADMARSLGIRVNCLRTSVVLGKGGGAMESMLPAFRFGVGGKLGTGQQWMSWIHMEDWIGMLVHLLKNSRPSGPVNLTAPHPVRNVEFATTLGRILHRPALLTVPAFALRLLLGEMSSVVLTSQRVVPTTQYEFRFPTLETALRSLL